MLTALLAALVLASPPREVHADAMGYCACEFKEAYAGAGVYRIRHHSQGEWFVNRETYDWFTCRTSSPFTKPFNHSRCVRKWRWETPAGSIQWATVTPPNVDFKPDGCWHRGVN